MNIALSIAVVTFSAAILFAGIRLAGRLPDPWVTGVFALALVLFIVLFALQWINWIAGDVLILVLSLSAGRLIGGMVKSWQALIVFCLTMAAVDLFSFYFGPTASLIQSYRLGNSLPLQYLSVSVPMGDEIQPVMGIGDAMAVSSAYAILIRLRYPAGWAFFAPLAGLLIALAVGLAVGGIFALPFVAGTLIAYILIDQILSRRVNP